MARDWKTIYNPTQSTHEHTLLFPQPAVAGHRIVAISASAATITHPAGWIEHTSIVQDIEATGASLTAAGGEQSVTVTLGPQTTSARALAGWLDSRDDLLSPHGVPVAMAGITSGGGALTIGTVTTTEPGCRIYAAVAQSLPTSAWTPVWPAPLAGEDVVYAAPPGNVGGGNEDIRLAVASGVAAAPGSYVITMTGLPPGTSMYAVAFAFSGSVVAPPANAIEAENRLPGNPKSEWDISGIGSPTIQGFATAMSVNRGDTLTVKVHSPLSAWSGTVYRLGWYGGSGARKVGTITGAQTAQPAGTVDPVTGMVSCANWAANGSWSVPFDACPGVYIVKVARTDNAGLASHVGPFVVRDPARKAPMVVKTSDATWQAYNHAGANPDDILNGRSVYGQGTAAGFTFDQAVRTRAVSYDRPLVTRQHLLQTSIWNAEYPLIRWLERLSYDVDYVSSLDVDATPALLHERAAVVSSGHDEYWSAATHNAFVSARDTGVNLLFLSGNEAFWRINPDGFGRAYACWKDTHDGAVNPSGVYSGTWQDRRAFNPDRRPAAMLAGQRFRRNGIAAHTAQATAAHATSPFWRNTAVAALTGSQTWTSPNGIVGFEADEPADLNPAEAPAGLIRLSQASVAVTGGLSDDDGNSYDLSGTYVHAFTLYRAPFGALVFGAGTCQYAWALDDVHDRAGGPLVNVELQQALTNLLADMGLLPVSVPTGLVMPSPVNPALYGLPETEDRMTFVAAAKNAALNAIAGLVTHVAAHTGVPDAAGSGEVVGGTYARQLVAWNPAAVSVVTNTAAINIPIPAGTTVYGFGYWSALIAGTFYGHALVGNSKRGMGTVDSAGVTGDAIQSAGHGLVNGNRVVVYPVLSETLPAGLISGTVYYVVNATADTFQLSLTSGGAAVNETGQGELYWADCVPVTYEIDGTLTIAAGQLTLSGAVV